MGEHVLNGPMGISDFFFPGNYPLTVGSLKPRLIDERFGDGPRWYLYEPKDINMRVPDQISKCVLFVGLPDMPEPEYRGTAFIVTVPGTQSNHFAFAITARHVAEKLQGKEYYIRANKRDGTAIALNGRPSDPWWFHPTERDSVDAAVTFFSPAQLNQLAIEHVPLAMFADAAKIKEYNLGVGDEVFITGLFTKITETTKNVPIVRTGTVAMMPDEPIPFGDTFIDAYLIESRSIGGLSGSPVFVRETITIQVGLERSQRGSNIRPDLSNAFPAQTITSFMQGLGPFFFSVQ